MILQTRRKAVMALSIDKVRLLPGSSYPQQKLGHSMFCLLFPLLGVVLVGKGGIMMPSLRRFSFLLTRAEGRVYQASKMNREVFELGKALCPLSTIKEGQKLREVIWELQYAQNWLSISLVTLICRWIFARLAEGYFSEEPRRLLPEKAVSDFKECGKCLALDLGTAARFHIARAEESVLLAYLPKRRTVGIQNMRCP